MKIKALQDKLVSLKLDAALFVSGNTPDPNITYLTQMHSLTNSYLVVPAKAEPTLYASPLDMGRLRGFNVAKIKPLKSLPYKRIGIDKSSITLDIADRIKAKTISISPVMSELRAVKTRQEIGKIKVAADIGNRAFNSFLKSFDYATEAEARAALNYHIYKHAEPSFPTILTSGSNASVPHNIPDSRIKKGFCIIDFGVRYKGYCSDCTRTIFVGSPSKKDQDLYDMLLEVQKDAVNMTKEGITCKDIDITVRKKLGRFSQYFIHSLGHGIGVEVHEFPSIHSKSTDVLERKMAVTIEPGIYLPQKLGMRIEDLVIVGKGVLTRISKNLATI